MKRRRIIGITFFVLIILCACSKESEIKDVKKAVSTIETDKTDEETVEKEIVAPTKDEVYNKHQEILDGMTEKEINTLTKYIKSKNLELEQADLYSNIFERLSDPDDLTWNCFEKTGEVQIGWAWDGDLEYDESSGITYEEFLQKNGTEVITYNKYTADDFITTIKALKESMKNDELHSDLDNLIENMKLAKEKHDVEYVKAVYYILHDMDYYLLRYGPEEMAPYVRDMSTIYKYYGVLEIYK